MTVIAYDGRYVAADKQATMNGTPRTTTKLFRFNNKAVAFSGNADHGLMLLAWLKSGANPQEHPKPTTNDMCSYMYVFQKDRHVLQYETLPVPVVVEDKTLSAGTGRDAALVAMHCGKSAREAVEIACMFDVNCGMGVDVIDLWEIASDQVGGQTAAAEGGSPGEKLVRVRVPTSDGA